MSITHTIATYLIILAYINFTKFENLIKYCCCRPRLTSLSLWRLVNKRFLRGRIRKDSSLFFFTFFFLLSFFFFFSFFSFFLFFWGGAGGLFFLFSVSAPCFSPFFFFLGGGVFFVVVSWVPWFGGGWVVVLPGWLHLFFRVTIR